MKFLLTVLSSLGFIVSSICPGYAHDEASSRGDRNQFSITCLFNYGPAIVNCCKSIVVFEFLNPRRSTQLFQVPPQQMENDYPAEPPVKLPSFRMYRISVGDRNFNEMKAWLRSNLQKCVNNPPAVRRWGGQALRMDFMLLYSTEDPPAGYSDSDGYPILFRTEMPFKNDQINQSLLLGVPLTNAIFQWTDEDKNATWALIKKNMKCVGDCQ